MSEDRIDWADLMALGMVARDWFDDRERPVAALLGTALGGLPVSPAYMGNVLRTADALRSAYDAGQRDARPESAAARRARFGWAPLTEERRAESLDRALDEVTR